MFPFFSLLHTLYAVVITVLEELLPNRWQISTYNRFMGLNTIKLED